MKLIPLIPASKELFAIVDDVDFDDLNQFKWRVGFKNGKIQGIQRRWQKDNITYTQRMNRRILGLADPAIFGDHKNRNPLDKRRKNLRKCSNPENCCNRTLSRVNSSGFKGVCFHIKSKKWMANIKYNQKMIHLGGFDNPNDAAVAYDKKAVELFGEFAATNKQLKEAKNE